jgi:hypothetical protein
MTSFLLLFLLIAPKTNSAGEDYTADVISTIPWGIGNNELVSDWNFYTGQTIFEEDVIISPPKWAVTEDNSLLIVENRIGSLYLKKFDSTGILTASIDLLSYGFTAPGSICTSSPGHALIAWGNGKICLLDQSLSIIRQEEVGLIVPDFIYIRGLFKGNSSNFWILCSSLFQDGTLAYYELEYRIDGSFGLPILVWSGNENDPGYSDFNAINPTGNITKFFNDQYGFTYHGLTGLLEKKSPAGELVFTHSYTSDSGWEKFDYGLSESHKVNYSGDFYTLHATDQGVVLTKYTLQFNNPPVCILNTVTSMPYIGPLPASIEFDATGCSDPDPGDSITYEWDFDGDGNFSEPIDDAYTGPDNNPTHIYDEPYNGPVILRINDTHQESSICSVMVEVYAE